MVMVVGQSQQRDEGRPAIKASDEGRPRGPATTTKPATKASDKTISETNDNDLPAQQPPLVAQQSWTRESQPSSAFVRYQQKSAFILCLLACVYVCVSRSRLVVVL